MILYPCFAYRTGLAAIDSNEIFESYNKRDTSEQIGHYLVLGASKFIGNKIPSKVNTYSNESFIRLDSESPIGIHGLTSFWNDPHKSCSTNFKCMANFSTGWNDNSSIQISTTNNATNKWSSIIGQEVEVKANERYELVTHMKLNHRAIESHLDLEGFNETSKEWYQIEQCPSGVNGPLKWHEYKCVVTIEENITKVRPVLNAGWSSQAKTKATTWFDFTYMSKFTPFVTDPNLKAELVYQGLVGPVSMEFLGPNDFLVTENKGTLQRIVNGSAVTKPILDLDVNQNQGLLGIAVQKNINTKQASSTTDPTYVFLYFTGNKKENNLTQGYDFVSNHLYRYELVNNTLLNPKGLLDLPAGYDHNGGPILIGPDKNTVYVSIGDLENKTYQVVAHKALNNQTGAEPDGSGGILRVKLDGKPVDKGVIGNTYPLNLYYAYGIRESFGMDFDPVTGNLWDTENGANWGDEINLVERGFNGGWNKVQGIWKNIGDNNLPSASDFTQIPSDLVDFDGKGKYREPEFTWNHTVGPTALKFVSTAKLGKQVENDILVADVNNGRIYHFKLDQNRTGLILNGPLNDKVANSDKELKNVIFATGFGLITDLKIGPDGYLYIVVFNEGKIYRIVPRI
jgi:glucose/arabinose dehydrogenase